MFIFDILKKIKYANKVFSDNKRFLLPGKYILQGDYRVFFHCKATKPDETFIHTENLVGTTGIILKFLNLIGFFKVSNTNNDCAECNCTVIYIANNHDERREVKLFDFSLNKVIVMAVSRDEKEKNRRYMHSYSCNTSTKYINNRHKPFKGNEPS